jgi:hypothetical protein
MHVVFGMHTFLQYNEAIYATFFYKWWVAICLSGGEHMFCLVETCIGWFDGRAANMFATSLGKFLYSRKIFCRGVINIMEIFFKHSLHAIIFVDRPMEV